MTAPSVAREHARIAHEIFATHYTHTPRTV
jgi:hypothetical protein